MKTRKIQRRFKHHTINDPANIWELPKTHTAVQNHTTLFPSTIVAANKTPKVLIEGKNQRKIGSHVTKGRWINKPIFTLTLVERHTCPATNCGNWLNCYGNNMPFSRRHAPGIELETRLASELKVLNKKHPQGIVVRLHILGDFYSTGYVDFWWRAMAIHPRLCLFGYTSHHSRSKIGATINMLLNIRYNGRALIRFSAGKKPDPIAQRDYNTAETIKHVPRPNDQTLCPAQQDTTDEICCGNCTLCWNENIKNIVFVNHGRELKHKKRPPELLTAV